MATSLRKKIRKAARNESRRIHSEQPAALGPRKINIVLNWFEELKDQVPD